MDFFNTVVVDFQYLNGNSKNEFFIKELAICPLGKLNVEVYSFKPPYSKKHFDNAKAIQANNYMEKKFNVKWDDGNINYLKLDKIFSKFDDKLILVKGDQKKKIVKRFVSAYTKVENLEDLYHEIPNLKCLKNFKMCCENHNNTFEDMCAHRNVINLMMYVVSN